MRIRVPATSANLGPGFDALGMALTLPFEVEANGVEPAPESHIAVRAFRWAGGTGSLSVRTTIPPGKGLGYSGAARVAGILAAHVEAGRSLHECLADVLAGASELEGHADNAAPSLLGGVVAVAAGRAVRIPLAIDPTVVVWIPSHETSTDKSRSTLPSSVSFADAVFNVGRSSLLVAALASGDVAALRDATADRLHQDARTADMPDVREAMSVALRAGAWCSWLSGSGPTIACLTAPDDAERVAASLPTSGHTKILEISPVGAEVFD